MMGAGHAATGLAVGAASLAFAPTHSVGGQLAWVAVVGGAAYLPDMDQHGSTAGRTWGPITGALARVVAVVGRGHRGGSHDPLLAPIVVAALFYAASLTPYTAVVAVALAVALALEAADEIIPGDQRTNTFTSLALSFTWAWLLVRADAMPWLPAAAALGVLTHIAGDALTSAGVPVPLTWVGRKRTIGLRLFDAGHAVEKPIAWLSFAVTIACVGWFVVWPYLVKSGFGV